ncbi:MAG: hypothetical protein PVH54_04930 [Gammaproteobacteria bacterium]|jgi:hypothetical protein
MPAVACIVHQIRGRMRLRIREKRQNTGFFDAVITQLESLPGIERVTVNTSTGSVILYHELPNNEMLVEQLLDTGMFVFSAETVRQSSVFNPLRSSLSGIEQAIKSGTAGNVDLRTLAFLGMMGLTLHQVLRGQVLGPALPMLWNAFSLIGHINNTQPEPGPDPDA